MLFQTTAAHEELRAKIRSFAEEEIKPLAFLMDQNNEFPEEAVKKLGKLGWMGIPYPKEYGGTETTALDKGDYYLLNGGKIFITNAPKADTYVVFAVTTPDIGTRGISAFIVEKGWKGFEFGDNYDKMGIRSSSTAELIFNDVKVPKENLLGK